MSTFSAFFLYKDDRDSLVPNFYSSLAFFKLLHTESMWNETSPSIESTWDPVSFVSSSTESMQCLYNNLKSFFELADISKIVIMPH
jgi:hypothetical protein